MPPSAVSEEVVDTLPLYNLDEDDERLRTKAEPYVCEPRVLPAAPKKQKRQPLGPRINGVDPLCWLKDYSFNTKTQIDVCEKFMMHTLRDLHGSMYNALMKSNMSALRNSVADDLEHAIRKQWEAGVAHGMWTAKVEFARRVETMDNRIAELTVQLAAMEHRNKNLLEVLSRTGALPDEEGIPITEIEKLLDMDKFEEGGDGLLDVDSLREELPIIF
jgi:hypothetical protein